jgi:catechol 2,3-dioxygenase-like lactoylglutathione lyase family enzyme
VRINLASVLVDDQEKALRFYTEILGFLKKKTDVPVGQHRWLTVVSPDAPDALSCSSSRTATLPQAFQAGARR